MINEVKIHFMHENGVCFADIAKMFNISPREACDIYVKVQNIKDNHQRVVYRKRLNKTNVVYRHQQLLNHMRKL